jgi:diacylglycerol O-acyltransferase / wax synthase
MLLVASAVGDMLRTPGDAFESFARRAPDPAALLRAIAGAANGVVSTLRAVAAPAGADSLSAANVSDARVFARVDGALADHKLIREVHGATVNDVVLTVVAGALRAWLMARGEPVHQGTTVRALVPVSLRGHHATGQEAVLDDPRTGNHVSAYFVELPVGEPNPVIRLQQVAMSMRGLKDSGQALGAQTIISLAGYAPSTVHAMAARTANTLSRRVFGLMVTNVPGPQFPLYVIGARLRAAYPVAPLAHGQAIAIGVTSYDGSVYYGLLGDREAMPDMEVLAQCLGDSLAELVALSRPGPIRRRGAR